MEQRSHMKFFYQTHFELAVDSDEVIAGIDLDVKMRPTRLQGIDKEGQVALSVREKNT